MAQLSITNATVTVNNHEVVGWADEDRSLVMPDTELYGVRRGPNGDTVYNFNGMLGGEVQMVLLPTSPSAAFFIRMGQQIKNGMRIRVDADYQENSLGYSVEMRAGVLKVVPPGPSLGSGGGSNLTFTFDFESITSNFDNFDITTGLPITQRGVTI